MNIFDNNNKYGVVSKLFHLLRAVLLIAAFITVYFKEEAHMLLGITLFVIVLVNILWRLFNRYPNSDYATLPEKNIKFIIFFSMYFSCFLIPILGYLGVRRPMDLGLFTIYPIYEIALVKEFVEGYLQMNIRSLTRLVRWVHEYLVYFLLFVLLSMHILASLFNVFFRKK